MVEQIGGCFEWQAFFLLLANWAEATIFRLPLRALPISVATSADSVRLRDDTDHSRARTSWVQDILGTSRVLNESVTLLVKPHHSLSSRAPDVRV